MVHDPSEARKEVSRVDLAIAAEMLRARRNGALFVAFALAGLIGWQGWNPLLFLLPAIIGLYATITQVNLRLIAAELRRCPSESEKATQGISEDTEQGGDAYCNLDQIEKELLRIQRDADMVGSEEEKQILLKRLSELKRRLNAPQAERELKVENVRLELARELQDRYPNRYHDNFLPTFDEWMSAEGCSGAKGMVRDSLLISYTEELERRYNRELGASTPKEDGEGEAQNEGDTKESLDVDQIEKELSHLRRQADLVRTDEEKEVLRRRLLALGRRVDARQSQTESKAENLRLEMVRKLRAGYPNRNQEDFLPPFDEWLAVEGCRSAKGTVRDSLFILYCEEMERRYRRELEEPTSEENWGCEAQDDACANESFDLDSVIARAEGVKGGPLTPQERAEFEHRVLELEELETKIAQLKRARHVRPPDDT